MTVPLLLTTMAGMRNVKSFFTPVKVLTNGWLVDGRSARVAGAARTNAAATASQSSTGASDRLDGTFMVLVYPDCGSKGWVIGDCRGPCRLVGQQGRYAVPRPAHGTVTRRRKNSRGRSAAGAALRNVTVSVPSPLAEGVPKGTRSAGPDRHSATSVDTSGA